MIFERIFRQIANKWINYFLINVNNLLKPTVAVGTEINCLIRSENFAKLSNAAKAAAAAVRLRSRDSRAAQ